MAFANVQELVSAAEQGSARAIGRLISMVENNSPSLREAMQLMSPHTGRSHVVGITGSPGVGKSTSTTALIAALRVQGRRVIERAPVAVKQRCQVWGSPGDDVHVMRAIKAAFDPQHRLNPGRFLGGF